METKCIYLLSQFIVFPVQCFQSFLLKLYFFLMSCEGGGGYRYIKCIMDADSKKYIPMESKTVKILFFLLFLLIPLQGGCGSVCSSVN